MRHRGMVILAASLMLAEASMAFADAWVQYVNDRFGTSAEVPAAGFVADPPPENDDGRSWTSADGNGKISIYGSLIVGGIADNVQEYQTFELDSARDSGVNVTYKTGKGDWFAYSGTSGDDIIYMKVIVTSACENMVGHHIYLKYPAAQQVRYAPIVEHMARTLKGDAGAACQ